LFSEPLGLPLFRAGVVDVAAPEVLVRGSLGTDVVEASTGLGNVFGGLPRGRGAKSDMTGASKSSSSKLASL
jgi:hypothetical protein